jgi:excisionase family DNA binding protein
MKIELETGDIERIVEKVVERLKPLLSNSHDSKDDELMDVKGLAGYLKVKKQWVYEKTHLGIIPYYKVGKYPRYRKSKIDEWLLKKENRNNIKRVI